MTSHDQTPNEERIDRYLDGAMSADEVTTFDEELRESAALRHQFRLRVRLHGLLATHFELAASAGNLPPLVSLPQPSRRRGAPSWWVPAVAAVVVLALGLVFLLKPGEADAPASFAAIRTVDEAIWTGGQSVEIGQVITDEWRKLESGFVELICDNGVILAIESPATFRFKDAQRFELEEGELSATVPPGAEGFTVETSQGEVVDLGTRFGVSVRGDQVEAHVFEGEIEVKPTRHEAVRLQTEEAIDLSRNLRQAADPAAFPMSSFPLKVDFQNAGFESDHEITIGLPKVVASWGGDEHAMVETHDGVTPVEGKRMVQFLSTFGDERDGTNRGTELWQLIDLTRFDGEIKRGGAIARFSAQFNRVPGSPTSDRLFGIGLTAFQGAAPLARRYWSQRRDPLSRQMTEARAELSSDDDPGTWEALTCEFVIPAGTDFLIAQIYAFEDQSNDLTGEFDGHFADACRLEVTTRSRRPEPFAIWQSNQGNWHDPNNWEGGLLPDETRDTVRIVNADEVLIDRPLHLKQDLWLAYHRGRARLRVAPEGELQRTGAGELVLGLNRGGVAEMVVEGRLTTSGKVFIGRNNAASKLIVDGGQWVSRDGVVRLSQYGNHGPDTVADLIVKNDGQVTAKAIELVHDQATLTIESGGLVDVERLQVGGDDGKARVLIRNGVLRVKDLGFGRVDSVIKLADNQAVVELPGAWDEEALKNLPHSRWMPENGLVTQSFTRNGKRWTRVMGSGSSEDH